MGEKQCFLSPPPCGEGSQVGVEGGSAALPYPPTPHANPPTAEIACTRVSAIQSSNQNRQQPSLIGGKQKRGLGHALAQRDSTGTRLPTLRACLRAAETRSRIGSILRGAVFSLVAALALLCGLEIAGLYFDIAALADLLALPAQHPLFYLAFSAAAFACTFAFASLLAFIRPSDAAVLARKADRALALAERLSTALEVDESLPPDAALGPVPSALLADAERWAAIIDPRQIVGLHLPRAVWAVPGLIAAAVLIQLVPSDAIAISRGSIASAEPDERSLTGQQRAEAAANLRSIAELLDKDAQERSDPYLRTIVRTLERLSGDAERPGTGRRALAGALEELLAHTRQAYGRATGAAREQAPRDVVQQLQAALDNIAGKPQEGAATAREPERREGAGNVTAPERGQTRRPAQPSERKTASVGTRSQTATLGRQPSWDDFLKDLDDYDPVDPRIEKERAFADQQRRARAASQSAGAAQDAGQGAGDRAGDGTRPLGNGRAAATELAPALEMLLPDQTVANGGRIRIELPSEAMRSTVAPPTAGTGGEWRRALEQAVARAVPGPEDRKVIGRYFLRPAEGRGP